MNYEEFIEYLERTPYVGNQEQCGTGKDYNCDPNRIKKDAQVKLSLKKSLEKIKDKANVLLQPWPHPHNVRHPAAVPWSCYGSFGEEIPSRK